jgi:hypothetical protein
MGTISGRLEPRGAFVEVTVSVTPQRAAMLGAAGLPIPAPLTVRALIDIGASGCALDNTVIRGLNLTPTGKVLVHTPSTGAGYVARDEYDVGMVIGAPGPGARTFIVGVVGADLAGEGFLALIGWEVLNHCTLFCDGPAGTFTLTC